MAARSSPPTRRRCPPDVEPWLPLGPEAGTRNVAAQLADPASMLALTRRLLALRRSSRALPVGDYVEVPDVPPDCLAYLRRADDERLLVALNFGRAGLTLRPAGLGRLGPILGTHADDRLMGKGELHLRPAEGVILRAGG